MTILRLLLRSSTNVNTIIKQTSSDRSHIIAAIKTLQREELIIEDKSPDHKQKKIKSLTPLGEKLAKIIEDVKRYQKSYNKLREKRKEIFDKIGFEYNGVSLKSILRAKGWSDEEINTFEACASGVSILDYASSSYIKDALLFKYASIRMDYNLYGIGKAIFNKIIRNIIDVQITNLLDDFEQGGSPYLENIYEDGKADSRTNIILYFPQKLAEYSVLNNRFINKEAKEVLTSIFSLFELNSSDEVIEKVKNDIRICENRMNKDKSEKDIISLRTQIGNLKQLLNFYEDITYNSK